MLSAKAFLDFSMRSSEPNNAKSKLFTISLRVGIITMHFRVNVAWLQFLIAIRSAIPLAACLVFVLLCLKSDELINREKMTSEGIDGGSISRAGHTLTPLHIETRPTPGVDAGTALKLSNHCQKHDLYWFIQSPLQAQLERPLCFSLNKYIWKCSVTVYGNVCARRMFEPIPWKQAMFRADSLSPLIAGNGFQMCVARWSLSAQAPSSCLIKPLQGVPDGGMIPGLGRRPRQLLKYSSGSLWNNNSHISSSWELHHHIFQIWKQLLSI